MLSLGKSYGLIFLGFGTFQTKKKKKVHLNPKKNVKKIFESNRSIIVFKYDPVN